MMPHIAPATPMLTPPAITTQPSDPDRAAISLRPRQAGFAPTTTPWRRKQRQDAQNSPATATTAAATAATELAKQPVEAHEHQQRQQHPACTERDVFDTLRPVSDRFFPVLDSAPEQVRRNRVGGALGHLIEAERVADGAGRRPDVIASDLCPATVGRN